MLRGHNNKRGLQSLPPSTPMLRPFPPCVPTTSAAWLEQPEVIVRFALVFCFPFCAKTRTTPFETSVDSNPQDSGVHLAGMIFFLCFCFYLQVATISGYDGVCRNTHALQNCPVKFASHPRHDNARSRSVSGRLLVVSSLKMGSQPLEVWEVLGDRFFCHRKRLVSCEVQEVQVRTDINACGIHIISVM